MVFSSKPLRAQGFSKPDLDEEEIIIQKNTTFTALDNSNVNFGHNELLTISRPIPDIFSKGGGRSIINNYEEGLIFISRQRLDKVASEQLASAKAHFLQVSSVKQI